MDIRYWNRYWLFPRLLSALTEAKFVHLNEIYIRNYIFMNFNCFFQTRHAIGKVLDWENSHLYHKVSIECTTL